MKKIQLPANHPLLINHVVLNQGIFPAVGYFEIVLEALLEQAPVTVGEFPVKITDAVWSHPLLAQTPVNILFKPNKMGYRYRVQTIPKKQLPEKQRREGQSQLHASGNVHMAKPKQAHNKQNLNIAAIKQQLGPPMEQATIYQAFEKRGIRYKKLFRSLEKFWCRDNEALGHISHHSGDDHYHLKPGILDNALQCALLNLDQFQDPCRLFVPFSLQEIIIWEPLCAPCYIKTILTEGNATKNFYRFDLTLTDEQGRCLMEMKDLCVKAYVQETPEQWAIAATFTAEPLKNPLAFWVQQLDWQQDIHFAPYNQVFQELLNPQSLLSQNQAGVNSILFRLEDLKPRTDNHTAPASPEEKDALFGDSKRLVLPNGLDIAHLHRYETEYLYKEIFVEKTYIKHGIELKEGACVLDIGANIGMFALFIAEQCKSARVYSFEPSPITYDILQKNLALHCPNAMACNIGIADSDREAEFTFYPHSTVFSGFHADNEQDGQSLKQAIKNELAAMNSGRNEHQVEAHADLMMKDRLHKESYTCQLRSLSSFMKEQQIGQIDLLKVDAEKCEWQILSSIGDNEWQKIRQVVVEVHDNEGTVLRNVKTLLEEKGFHIAMEEEGLLKKSGLYNLYGKRPEAAQTLIPSAIEQGIEHNLSELLNLLRHAHKTMQLPLLLALCPPTPDMRQRLSDAFMQRMQASIDQALQTLPNISAIYLATPDTDSHSGNHDYYDAVRDNMGNIPYTPRFFASIATALARRLYALKQANYKCIALDCDNTLWSGIVGEQGAAGIHITTEFQLLHQFMLAQKRQGMLLCLLSKNNENDVKQVFSTRQEMGLEWQDLSGWKINWNAKSSNLRALAQEMNIGLDSIIFLDDSPVECAEVRANCPEVLTLQVPARHADIAEFLNHVWAFDHINPVTQEDIQRTAHYQQQIKREQLRKTALTFKDFIAELELKVSITRATPQDYPRIAQLTQRTNQFNVFKKNLTLADIETMLPPQSPQNLSCHVVHVKDRFGDYGLCGLIMHTVENTCFEITSFLLSCRALGRGVEHNMLAFLGQLAHSKHITQIKIPFIATSKNSPAGQFLQDIGNSFLSSHPTPPCHTPPEQETSSVIYNFSSQWLKELVFSPAERVLNEPGFNKPGLNESGLNEPGHNKPEHNEPEHNEPGLNKPKHTPPESIEANHPPHSSTHLAPKNRSALMQRLGDERSCIESIMAHTNPKPITASPPKEMSQTNQVDNPEQRRQSIENIIMENLSQLLNIEQAQLSLSDPFSDFGLDSMGNIDLIVKLNEALDITLPTTTLFDYSCVNELSRHLCEKYPNAAPAPAQTSDALAIRTVKPENQTVQDIEKQQATRPIAEPHQETGIDSTAPQTTHDSVVMQPSSHHKKSDIAVVGMSGRFPGADNIEEFWQLLAAGKSGISEVPAERWAVADYYNPDKQKPNKTYSKWGGFLKNIDQFDASFFKISNREAEQIDPQQRIFLEESWHALEHAGYLDLNGEDNQWGVFVGADGGDYQAVLQQAGVPLEAPSFMGNHASILAARIAYLLNFKGAALAIDTACSSSLVAVHWACESLRSRDIDLALAGGVSIRCGPAFHILSSKAGMLAADAECKAFDAQADGFVPGEAVAIAVLKRITDAQRDHDTIYSVIKGSAINQDGKTNGITAPSGLSQTKLALKVYQQYGINPGDIGFVEAHGTGTPLGDPIEVNALTDAFRTYTDKTSFCAIGSAKSNIGHCTHAAGITGLIKLILCLHHKKRVANVSFSRPNPHIAFDDSPFFVSTRFCDWTVAQNQPRLGAVSSFGFSGTNAHIVVSEAPEQPQHQQPVRPCYLVTLSAKTSTALKQLGDDLSQWLVTNGLVTNGLITNGLTTNGLATNGLATNGLTTNERAIEEQKHALANIAYTLSVGRGHFDQRWAVVVSSTTELGEALQQIVGGKNSHTVLSSDQLNKNQLNDRQLNHQSHNPSPPISNADRAIYKQVLNQVTAELNSIDPLQNSAHYRDLLMALGGLYVKGYISDISETHKEQGLQRIALPTYPFSKQRHWATNRHREQRQQPATPSASQAQRIALAEQHQAPTNNKAKPNNISLVALTSSLPESAVTHETAPAANIAIHDTAIPNIDSKNIDRKGNDRNGFDKHGIDLRNHGNGLFSVTISAPETKNVLSDITIEALSHTLTKLQRTEQVKVLIFSGRDTTFLVGGRNQQNAVIAQKLHLEIASLPFITIAAMKGDALGAGFLIGALCDFMICSREHHYGYTHNEHNLFPTEQEDDFFIERFGYLNAQTFLYSSQPLSGEQLHQQGWRCTILGKDQVDAYAQTLAIDLIEASRESLYLLKQHLSKNMLMYLQHLAYAPLTVFATPFAEQQQQQQKQRLPDAKTSGISSPSPLVKLASHAGNVLLVNVTPQSNNTHQGENSESLLLALEDIFSQLSRNEHYAAVVFTSEHPGFLPLENLALPLIHRFQSLFLNASVPVVAALGSPVNDTRIHDQAWLASLFCDALVYDENGVYSYGNVSKHGEASKHHQRPKAATAIFSLRFGHYLAQEIMLTGGQYSGRELRQRSKTVIATSAHKVVSQAMHIAQSWCDFSTQSLMQWKQRTSATIKNKIALCIEQASPESTAHHAKRLAEHQAPYPHVTSPTPVILNTKVIKATLHPQGVLVVNMEDRDAKNMFSDAYIQGLTEVFEHIEQSPNYKVVILTGYDTYFSTGGTQEGLKAIQEGTIKYSDAPIFQLPLLCKLPVIAAMQGHGIGGGWALGMFADFILFSEESRYCCNFMRFGFTPGAGSTLLFPHHLGMDLSKEALLTAREYTGKTLQDKGLNLPVVPRKHIDAAAMALAEKIARLPYPELLALKQQFASSLRQQLAETYRLELAMHAKTFVNNAKTLEKIQQNFHQGVEAATPPSSPQAAPTRQTMLTGARSTSSSTDLPSIQGALKKLLAEELYMQEDEIQEQRQFVDLGLDSITGVTWVQKINHRYGTHISTTKVYTYPTLAAMSQHVMDEIASAIPTHQFPIEAPKTLATDQPAAVDKNNNIGQGTASSNHRPAIQATLKRLLAEELYMAAEDIDATAQFVDIGLDSITGVTWIQKINQTFGTTLEATKVYTYPTLVDMSQYVMAHAQQQVLAAGPAAEPAPTPISEPISTLTAKLPPELPATRSAALPLTFSPNQISNREPASATTHLPLQQPAAVTDRPAQTAAAQQTPGIAVIGMAGKFPQADNAEAFWKNIVTAKDCIVAIPKHRWDIDDYYDEQAIRPRSTNCRWMGAVEGIDLFDPQFFDIPTAEANAMDPQQRLFLEACWHSIEDAGYNPDTLSGSQCGVFSGCVSNDYTQLSPESGLSGQGLMGSATSILAARISYFLNLQGPCLSIDTACSSSLVAIANACDSLTAGNCDLALAGGVHIMAGPSMHIMTGKGGMLSPQGRCFAFDQRANGFVPADAVGVILLKPLHQAQQDNDPIYGVIQGWGVNQDGRTNGLNAPNPQSQTRLQQRVYQQFQINPAEIQMVEAHGTGTKLGDPMEVEALWDSFKPYTNNTAYCALGSVKSNVGHSLTAAGVSGVIKVLLALKHKTLPPTIHFEQLNEHIRLQGSPFYINTTAKPWPRPNQGMRQAAINAFGLNGTNAHMVIAEVPIHREQETTQRLETKTPKSGASIAQKLFPLSAKTPAQLQLYARRVLLFIKDSFIKDSLIKNSFIENASIDTSLVEAHLSKPSPALTLDNMIYTFQVGRQAMNHRLAIICSDHHDLMHSLQHYLQGQSDTRLFLGETKQTTGLTPATTADTIALWQQALGQQDLGQPAQWQPHPDLAAQAKHWVNEGELDWRLISPSTTSPPTTQQRISGLPLYPFIEKRCWWATPTSQEHLQSGDNVGSMSSTVPTSSGTVNEAEEQARRFLQALVAEQLQQPLDTIPLEQPFSHLGINSLHIIKLSHHIKSRVGNDFSPTQFFKHTNLAALAAYLVEHFPNTLADLTEKSQAAAASPPLENTPRIVPRPADRYLPFPLTDIQQSFLTGRKLSDADGNSVGCHIYLEMEFDNHNSHGPLDIYRLNSAWKRLVEHHEMLRAVILSSGQQQILTQVPPYKFKVLDLRRQSDTECAESRQQLRARMSHQVYQANHWPLFEIQISTCAQKCAVHFSIDELILDAFSLELLCYQWKQCYHTPDWALPSLELSFRDYVIASNTFETSTPYQQDLQYWLTRLKKMPSGPQLPLNTAPDINPAPGTTNSNVANTRIRLTGNLKKPQWQKLKNKMETLNVSPTVLLLQVFSAVLRSYSETDRFALILTFFNRLLHPQIDQVLAPFISTNVFVVETPIAAEKTSATETNTTAENQQLQQLQTRLFDDLGHNSVSGIRVLRELKKRGDISKTLSLPVVFTSLLGHQQWDGQESFLDDVRFAISQTPQIALDHQIHEKNGGLIFNWDINPDYYAPGLIDNIFSDYCSALHRLADDLHLKIIREEPTRPYPLSDQQQAYAFGRTRHGAQMSAQVYTYFEVENLDLARLENAWQKTLAVHDILVTVIHPNGTQQRLPHIPEYAIRVNDLRAFTGADIAQALNTTEVAIMNRLCPLGEWPYFDLQVSHIDKLISGVHFSLDLMIADGPSIELLQKQLFYFYDNPVAPAKSAAISYSDYILTLQNYQQTESYRNSLQYWKNKFADMPPGPSLPSWQGTVSNQTERLEGTLAQWSKIKSLAAKLHVAPSMILLTVYADVLAAWSGAASFSIVIPSWERLPLHPGINDIAGDFTAMSWVVIERTIVDKPAPSFEKKVRHYHRIVQQDLSHRAVSGLRALRTVVAKNRSAIDKKPSMLTFPIVFTDLSTPIELNLPKGVRRTKSLSQTPQVDLDNISTEQNEQLHLHWDVAKGRFPDGMIQEIFAAYQRVLEYLAEVPYSWKETNFDHLINAQAEKFQARATKSNDARLNRHKLNKHNLDEHKPDEHKHNESETKEQHVNQQAVNPQIVEDLASDSVEQA